MSNTNNRDHPRDLRTGSAAFEETRARWLSFSLPWATSMIVAANLLVFAVMALSYHSVLGFSPLQLAAWGGNSGLLDLSGQWWRLLTYQFLHLNIWHVAVNMWVLWSVGRLTERFYGSWTLLGLYLASGILAGFASMAWRPEQISVGASGSIFGVLGAFLVFLYTSRREIPVSILNYWLPALLFTGFSLFNGAYQPAVDNAAHVGGLLAGFMFGAFLSSPGRASRLLAAARIAGAAAAFAASAAVALWYIGVFDARTSPIERFARSHSWYLEQETPNLLLWQRMALQAGTNSVSGEQIEQTFEHDILPFWQTAYDRLQAEARKSPNDKVLALITEFARVRLAWAKAIIAAAGGSDPQAIQTALDLAEQTNLAQARLDRLKLLESVKAMPRALSDTPFAVWLSQALPGHSWQCVTPPATVEKPVAENDAREDGPARRHNAGCDAQQLFLTGQYQALDARMKDAGSRQADLPDGSSSLDGIVAGLNDLFEYGRVDVEQVLRRTAQWRRMAPGSSEPDLIEAIMFHDWAYGARGHGYATSVSQQAMEIYLARSEMAAETLREAAHSAADNPIWYQMSLSVARDQSMPIGKMQEIFDTGSTKFPQYLPIYRQMLVTLMPRWMGSTDMEKAFITAAAKKAGHGQLDPATYARLYLVFGYLERDDYNVVEAAGADGKIMRSGLEALQHRYPHSDYIMNAVAHFACIDNEYPLYKSLQPRLTSHFSSTAWPDRWSVAMCDKWAGT